MRWAGSGSGSLYRGTWWAVTALLMALGVVGGCVLLGPVGALLLGGTAVGLTGLSGWRLRVPLGGGKRTVPPVVLGMLCGVTVLAVVGLTAELGALGLLLCLVVAAAGWPVLRPGRRPARPRGAAPAGATPGGASPSGATARLALPRPPAAPAPNNGRKVFVFDVPPMELLPQDCLPPLSGLSTLSTSQLCWAWRLSYVRVARTSWGSELDHLAELRRGYLDELQRRDPGAFGRWFPTARAASDPARFFCCAAPASLPRSPTPQPAPQSPPPTIRGQRNDASKGSQTSGAAG